MIPKTYDEIEFIDDLTNPIDDIMQKTQYNVLTIITSRINAIGKLSATDAQRLSQLVRQQDLDTIESIIAAGTNLSLKQVDSIIESAAQNNDDLAEYLYKYRNMPPSSFKTDLALLNIVEQAKKSTVNGIVKLSNTSAMNLVINGKVSSIEKAYNYAVNRAIFEVQQGYFDYNTAMRSVITELSRNGLGVIEYESGYRRRLDSAVRMNIQDGVRGLNVAYREKQGEQFGADGIELSAHAMSEPIHGQYQGKQYTKKQFEELQSRLERPFFVMNCRHSSFPIIMGLSKQVHSDEELDQYNETSSRQVEYSTLKKDSDGNYIKKTLPKYQATQVQRNLESEIRKLKDYKNQIDILGDKTESNIIQKKIKEKTKYYKTVSEQIGISPRLDRTRVVK